MRSARYCVKVYNGSYARISVCYPDSEGLPGFAGGGNRKQEQRKLSEEEMFDNLMRSAKRAYQTALCKAKALGVDRMLTLTFARNVVITMKEQALSCFARFTRLCRAQFGEFEYLATLETQKRGAIHFHLAVNRYYNVWQLWELWKKAVVESGLAQDEDKIGSVYINKRANQSKGGIAKYVCKYIMKEFYNSLESHEQNRKRYFSSKMKIEKLVFEGAVCANDYGVRTLINDFLSKNPDFSQKMIKIGEFSHVPNFVLGMNWAFSECYII